MEKLLFAIYEAFFTSWLIWVVLPVIISIIYFFLSPKTERLYKRIIVSLHGVVIALSYLGAMIIFAMKMDNPKLLTPFLFLQIVPIILIVISFIFYKGRKSIHILQPLNLLCLFQTTFIGSMAVTGDWL